MAADRVWIASPETVVSCISHAPPVTADCSVRSYQRESSCPRCDYRLLEVTRPQQAVIDISAIVLTPVCGKCSLCVWKIAV